MWRRHVFILNLSLARRLFALAFLRGRRDDLGLHVAGVQIEAEAVEIHFDVIVDVLSLGFLSQARKKHAAGWELHLVMLIVRDDVTHLLRVNEVQYDESSFMF